MTFGTFDQPFSAQSPWNVRPNVFTLGTYQIPTTRVDGSTMYDAYIGGGPYSVTRFLASPSDPAQVVYGINGPGTSSLQNTDSETYDESVLVPHFPASVVGAAGADGHADIYDPATNRIYSFYQLGQHGSDFWAQGFSWTALDGRGWGDPAHYQQGARATGVPTGGGVIPFAFVDGDHYPFALACSLDWTALNPAAPGYVFPATNADYNYYNASGQIPEGSLLMLPQSFAEFAVPSSDGVNERLNKIIRTLKLYGCRVVDRNTDTRFVFYVEGTSDRWIYPSGYDYAIAQRMNTMAVALRVATVTSYIDGNGASFNLPKNLNLLSLRQGGGEGYILETGATKGTFDTFTQSVTFAANGEYTVMKTPDVEFPYQAKWATPNAGDVVTFTVTAIGGAKCQCQLFNSNPVFDSGLLGNGETATFTWPDAGVAKRIRFASGPTGGGTLSATLIGPSGAPAPAPAPPAPAPPAPAPPAPAPPALTTIKRKVARPRNDVLFLDQGGKVSRPWIEWLRYIDEEVLGGLDAVPVADIAGIATGAAADVAGVTGIATDAMTAASAATTAVGAATDAAAAATATATSAQTSVDAASASIGVLADLNDANAMVNDAQTAVIQAAALAGSGGIGGSEFYPREGGGG